jgi:hypothetical protein
MRQNGFRHNPLFYYIGGQKIVVSCVVHQRAYKRSQIKKINYKVLGTLLITTISLGHVSIQSHLRNWKFKFEKSENLIYATDPLSDFKWKSTNYTILDLIGIYNFDINFYLHMTSF